MHNTNKERGLRDNGSNANTKICSEVQAPSSTSPPSSRRISNPLGVPNSSLNQYKCHRSNTNTIHLTNRDRPLAKQPQITSTEEGYKPTPTPPHQEGVNHNLNLYQRGSNPNQPLPKRDTTNERVYNKWYISTTNQILFPQIMIL